MRRARGRAAGLLAVAAIAVGGLTACDDGGSDGGGVSAADAREDAFVYPEVDFGEDPLANIERLQVPDEELAGMSTEALAWTVLDFPYFGNAFASNQSDGQVAFLAGQCNALDALLRRDDAADAVEAVRQEFVDSGAVAAEEFGEMKLEVLELIAAEVAPA